MLNENQNDSSIEVEEELMEDYEPSPQDVREYGIYLGMKLPEDNQYLEIARAGLKEPLPPEWKAYLKKVQGQDEIYYKNINTKEISVDHPCDTIFREKFLQAKAQNLRSHRVRKTGVAKLKQIIQERRGNYQQEESDIQLMEQNLLSEQEFVNLLQDFEDESQAELLNVKEENQKSLNQMELMLMNEADQELLQLKAEYERRNEQFQKNTEERKQKIKKKLECEFEQTLTKLQSQCYSLKENLDQYRMKKQKEFEKKVQLYEKRYSVYQVMKILIEKWQKRKPSFDKAKFDIVSEFKSKWENELSFLESNMDEQKQKIFANLQEQLNIQKKWLNMRYNAKKKEELLNFLKTQKEQSRIVEFDSLILDLKEILLKAHNIPNYSKNKQLQQIQYNFNDKRKFFIFIKKEKLNNYRAKVIENLSDQIQGFLQQKFQFYCSTEELNFKQILLFCDKEQCKSQIQELKDKIQDFQSRAMQANCKQAIDERAELQIQIEQKERSIASLQLQLLIDF